MRTLFFKKKKRHAHNRLTPTLQVWLSSPQTRYFKTDQYFEIDVDISSSAVANGITRFVIGYMKALVIDLGFTVEGQAAEELPEELMGVIRVMNLDPAKAKLTSMSS